MKYKILFFSLFSYSNFVFAVCESMNENDWNHFLNKHSPVTLVFFSSWCSDCKDKILDMKKKKGRKENFILINTFDSLGKGEKVLKNLGIDTFCVYDKNRELAKKYHVDSVPKNILIEKME